MPIDWSESSVRELQERGILLVEDGNHGEYRPRRHEFGEGSTRYIRASNMTDARVRFRDADLISDAAVERIRKGVGRGGDIIFSHKGTVGKLALTPRDAPPFVCSPQTTFWRALNDDVLDPRFLYYLMQSRYFERQWRVRKGETDMADYVSLTAQRNFKVLVPGISTQRAIADVLGSLDDKIELNRRMNRTLEATARAIFRSWFVDFDPVVAKEEGREPFGMDAETAALFPDRFVNSQMGPIPEGWEVDALPERVRINPRRTLEKGEPATYAGMADLSEHGAIPDHWSERPYGSGMRFKNGDTLLARITPSLENGKTAFVNFLEPGEVAWGSTEYVVLRPKPPLPEPYAYFLARTPEIRVFGVSHFTGSSGRQRVPTRAWSHLYLPWPPERIARRFGNLIAPVMQKLLHNHRAESQTLASLRDLLLPKLLSGEVRVPEAAELAESVA